MGTGCTLLRFCGRVMPVDAATIWRVQSHRRRWRAGLAIGYLPIMGGTLLLVRGTPLQPLAFGFAAAWIVALLNVQVRLALFRCPRCGNRFAFSGARAVAYRPWTQSCLHCDL